MKAADINKLRQLAAELAAACDARVDIARRLAPHTSYRIGGPTDLWVAPRHEDGIQACVHFARSRGLPLFVLGRGSNVLVSDQGWRGITLYLGENYSGWRVEQETLRVRAGAALHDLVLATADAGLAGIELLAGIPGGVGGALRMNAGAFGQQIASVVTRVEGVALDGAPYVAERTGIDFGYRRVPALEAVVVTGACLRFRRENPAVLRRRVAEVLALRDAKQPLDHPSCGSVFKRPPGYYAGALIEAAGLKGARVGGAEVSRKHAGFILNVDRATAADVYRLIRRIEERVLARFGVRLEREVKLVGEFEE